MDESISSSLLAVDLVEWLLLQPPPPPRLKALRGFTLSLSILSLTWGLWEQDDACALRPIVDRR